MRSDLVQIVLAIGAYEIEAAKSVVNSVLAIAGFAFGPILGVFLLARFLARVSQSAVLVGMISGVVVLTIVWDCTTVHWSWYTLIGSAATIGRRHPVERGLELPRTARGVSNVRPEPELGGLKNSQRHNCFVIPISVFLSH